MSVTINREQRAVLYAAAQDMPTPDEITRAEDEGREMDAIELRARHQHLGVMLDKIGWGEESPRDEIRVAHDWREGRAFGSGLVVLHRHAHRQLVALLGDRDDGADRPLEVLGICGDMLGHLTYDPFTGARAAGITIPSDVVENVVDHIAASRARRGIAPTGPVDLPSAPESQQLSERAVRDLMLGPVVSGLRTPFRDALHRTLLTELELVSDVRLCAGTGDIAGARLLRERFEDAARLLDDLGWGRHDPCSRFDITVPHPQLARTLLRLHGVAADEVVAVAARGDSVDEVREILHVAGVVMELLAGIVGQHLAEYDPPTR